ncbi:MAG TPA: polymer-forming cytoskeletal protein [Pyrinomonadaceae bacterium]|nr:polymer-forming cytoskeletal protein [Pyrinomonadaceae bacterium]
MPAVTPALNIESKRKAEPPIPPVQAAAVAASQGPRRLPTTVTGIEAAKNRGPVSTTVRTGRDNAYSFQARVPVITGEATFRGLMAMDGVITGQLGADGSALSIRQRPHSGPVESVPQLTGEISFKDMLRVNGHIAGKVFSFKGTLIIDGSARVDASIDVAVAVISGTVNGDVVGHERVELGPGAVINGNISTRSIAMKPGAVFHGDCRMLKNEDIGE